jgi:hypothetical protein
MRMRMLIPTAALLGLFSVNQTFADPVVVRCGAGERAVVRHTFVRGEPETRVDCAGAPGYRAVRDRYARRHRSWGKTALIVGGSAGTGAGIGGIVHGKKGALVGAALGGGLASLYEGAHRR